MLVHVFAVAVFVGVNHESVVVGLQSFYHVGEVANYFVVVGETAVSPVFHINYKRHIELNVFHSLNEIPCLFLAGLVFAEEVVGTHSESGFVCCCDVVAEFWVAKLSALACLGINEAYAVGCHASEIDRAVVARHVDALNGVFGTCNLHFRVNQVTAHSPQPGSKQKHKQRRHTYADVAPLLAFILRLATWLAWTHAFLCHLVNFGFRPNRLLLHLAHAQVVACAIHDGAVVVLVISRELGLQWVSPRVAGKFAVGLALAVTVEVFYQKVFAKLLVACCCVG